MKSLLDRLRTLARLDKGRPATPVVICGLSYEHYRLQALIAKSKRYEVRALINDYPWNHATLVEGVRVYYPSEAPSLARRHGVVALLYCQDSDLEIFDATTTAALSDLQVPFLKLSANGKSDIDTQLGRRLANPQQP
ncbi:hypothetical protein GCM10027040_10800 [Halomonas shantousis]